MFDSSTLSFEVTNVRNPRSLKPTSFFVIQTQDNEGYLVEESLDTAYVEMTSTPKITSSSVKSESKVVGELTDYNFRIRPKVPLIEGDILEIVLPD